MAAPVEEAGRTAAADKPDGEQVGVTCNAGGP